MIEQSNDFISFKYENKTLLILVKKEIPTDDEWLFSKNTMINYYKILQISNIKISLLFDIRKLGILNSAKYSEWAQLLHDRKNVTSEKINKTSVIINNAIVRGMVNVFFTLYTSVRPIKIFKTIEEGTIFISQEEQNNDLVENSETFQNDYIS